MNIIKNWYILLDIYHLRTLIMKAKLFKNGRSQAVRLPKEFRLPGNEAIISHMGDAIVLQPIRHSWLDIYNHLEEISDFMEKREDLPPEDRESF